MVSIKEDVAFIFKHFYVLGFIKQLNLDCHSLNQDDNNIFIFINNKTKNQILKEHKL